MARDSNFPYSLKADGFVSQGDGFEARRRTGVARISSSAVSHAITDEDGNAIALASGELISYISMRLINGVALGATGVVKVGLASDADATSASVAAAVLRSDDATPLTAATSFAAGASGYSLIAPQASVAASAGPLLVLGRNAAAAGASNVAIAPGADAPLNAAGDPTSLVLVEIYTISRKPPISDGELPLNKADQTTQTRVIEQ